MKEIRNERKKKWNKEEMKERRNERRNKRKYITTLSMLDEAEARIKSHDMSS